MTIHASLRRIATILRKEMLVLLDNKQARLMLIVPPLMQIVIFAWAATLEVRNVDVAVLNADNGLWSRELVHRVQASPTFTRVVPVQSLAQVRQALDRREVLLALVFDTQFSRQVERGETATVQALLDGRRSNAAQIANNYLEGILQGMTANAALRGKTGQMTTGAGTTESGAATGTAALGSAATGDARHSTASLPRLEVVPRFWFNPNLEFQWFFLPNLIGILSFMLGLVVTGLTVARERELGTFDQLLVSPAKPVEIALAKLLPGCVVGLCHGTLFVLIAHFGFGIPVVGSLVLLYVAMFLFSLAAGGMGLVVSSLSSTQQQAFLGAFTVGVPCVLISGAITPIENMPEFLQFASQANPLRHFITITQGVFLKDSTALAVSVHLLKIIAIAVVSVIISIWMFTRKA